MTRPPLRLGIDVRELQGRPTGVGRYLGELLARWTRDPALGDTTLFLYAPAPVASEAAWLGRGGAAIETRVVAGSPGTWWEQVSLPRAAGTDGLSAFFAPAYSLPLALRVPTAVSIHDVSFAAHPEWFTGRHGLRRRALSRWSARRAAAVLTLTEFSRGEIAAHLGVAADRVHVIAPAVDTHPAFALHAVAPVAVREPLVLYVGSIFNRRHVLSLIDAFAEVVRAVPGARLEIVGDNRTHPPQDPAARVAERGLGRSVTIRDYVDEETLAGLFARARAFAFLSEYEGFGLTPLEAMARGVPALVLDTDVAREAYADAAVYVKTPAPDAVARQLVRLLSDDAWRSERATAGRTRAASFSWDRAASATMDVLARVAR